MGQLTKNPPSPRADAAPVRTRYEDDCYTWVSEQVALLRAGRLDEIDAVNIAEELSDVGRSEYDKLESALAVLLMHMLKWDWQPERMTRSWDNTIVEQRRRYHVVLNANPGLKSRLNDVLAGAYADGRARASTETDLRRSTFPETCPYSWDDILNRPFDFDPPR